MFKNSTELLYYALRELQVAIKEDKKCVEIILSNAYSSRTDEIFNLNQKLEIRDIAELLRKVYKDYYIQSIICPKANSVISIKLPQVTTISYCPIVWKLLLQKK